MKPQEATVCLAMDAFRICIGMEPRNFTADQVIQAIEATRREQ